MNDFRNINIDGRKKRTAKRRNGLKYKEVQRAIRVKLEKDKDDIQFGFPKRTTNKYFYVCFIDFSKTFDRVRD